MFDPASGQAVNAQIVARDQLAVGALGIEEPALIVEDETTIVLPASRRAVAAADGAIDIRIKRQGVPTPLLLAEDILKGEGEVTALRKEMKLSEVACQVMWNRPISVVEEQAQALVRTAFSTSCVKLATCLPGSIMIRARCWHRRSPAPWPCQCHGRCGAAFHPPYWPAKYV